MAKKDELNVAKTIGRGFAYLQAIADEVLDMGFKGLKKVSKNSKKSKNEGTIKKGAKKVAGFVGEVGDSFYDKYEDIKAKKKMDEETEEIG